MHKQESHIHSLRVEGLVPGWVQPTHSGGKICSIAVFRGDIPRVLGNSIIHSINRFYEFLRSLLSTEGPEPSNRRDKPCTV